jgi:transposase
MDLINYEKIVKSEAAARRYLLRHCWKNKQRHCPRCGHTKIYTLADNRMRCAECRYTFHDFSRRWINMGGLSCRDWLRLIKLFELELTTHRMVSQLRLSYNTVYKAITTLRFAILAHALDASQLLDGELGRNIGFENGRICLGQGREKMYGFPVFGFLERNNWAFVDLLPGMEAETVFHFNLNFQLKLMRMGNIMYSDRYRRYDALIFCGDASLPMKYIKSHEHVAYVDSLKGGFWNFARNRLKRYNGVTPRRFPLYLKELEFRYNHKDSDIFPLLVRHLTDFVPMAD